MQTATWLLAYAAALGWLVDPLLARCNWPGRHPRAGLWLWHGVALGTIASLAAALFLLAHDVAEHGFVWGLNADKAMLHDAYATQREVPLFWNLAVFPLALGACAIALSWGRRVRSARRDSSAHRLAVEFRRPVATAEGGRLLVGVHRSAVPAIYCVARGSSHDRILATTGALQILDEEQLRAAVEHERAHVAAHHHTLAVLAESITSVARCLGMLRNYPRSVRTLMEWEADDVAATHHGRRTVAAALLQMGAAGAGDVPGAAASLGGDDVAARIRRLLREDVHARQAPTQLFALAAAVTLFATPIASSLTPAMSLAGTAETTNGAPASTPPDFVHHP